MKDLPHQSRRSTTGPVEERSRTLKPFAGTLAGIAGTAFAAAVTYYWDRTPPSFEQLRFSLFLLGYLLLLDIYKIFKQK